MQYLSRLVVIKGLKSASVYHSFSPQLKRHSFYSQIPLKLYLALSELTMAFGLLSQSDLSCVESRY